MGDCWIVYSVPWMGISRAWARESTKPRFEVGISWVKRRKDSIFHHHDQIVHLIHASIVLFMATLRVQVRTLFGILDQLAEG